MTAAACPGAAELAPRTAAATAARRSGPPVGVQVAAPHWRDETVLAVMAALEEHFRARPDHPVGAVPLETQPR